MKHLVLGALSCLLSFSSAVAAYRPDVNKPLGFPIYTNHPAGKQITSNQLPATTPPLAPEETQKQILVPPGFEVRLFASEPEVVNPVAMTWDERGRLWVLELYEYPRGAKQGEKGRDRIKILEDTDADGKADKVTVFADGFSLATGLALGNGGVYLGAAPNLYFLEDTNGDDKADKTTVLKTGFGMEDRYELLNGFAWGPDGWLYMTHGVFTHSKVRDPKPSERGSPEPQRVENSKAAASLETRTPEDDDGVRMDAALARYHPRTKEFEVFADGTSNPWGVDWNERGDAFVSACVIQHLFHLAPGGQYNRQGGTWANPYGYAGDLPSKGLPAIVNWRHYRAAHAGICAYQGNQYPAEWRGLIFLGNIHQNALNLDRLTPVGSTYKAEKESQLLGPSKGDFEVGAGNFLVSKDPWFRPVATHTGPDGALWVMDWCDKYPCYQNAQADPEGVDREMGRIWRVVWTGNQPGQAVASRPDRDMNLARLSMDALAELLAHPNNWHRRMAQRLITERRDPNLIHTLHPSSRIIDLARKGATSDARLAAIWTLHSAGALEEEQMEYYVKDTNAAVRAWTARLIGERGYPFGFSMKALAKLALDKDDSVRLAVAAAARQFNSGSLTVDTPPAIPFHEVVMGGVLSDLHKSPFHPDDPVLPFVYWMAVEPLVAFDASHALEFVENAKDGSISQWPMNNYILTRIMRRICDLGEPALREKHLNKAMTVLGGLASETNLANAALDGLIAGFRAKGAPPTLPLEPIFSKLLANPALADKARRLATLLGDTTASRSLIAKINDVKASLEERLKGIIAARETKDDAARGELLQLFKTPLTPALSPPRGEGAATAPAATSPSPLRGERAGVRGALDDPQRLYTDALRALGTFGGDDIAYVVTDAWKNFSPATRRVASEVLVLRSKWSRALLAAVDQKTVKPEDISATARRALARSEDATVQDHADRVLGKYRPPGEDKLKLIAEKRKIVLAAEPDLKNGYEVAKRTCFVCHKLHGEGADVGPDLTGVGRSTLDALLHNVIDPNEVVGNGNEATEVELKDGTTVSGRIVEDSPTRLKLLASGPTEHVIAKSDIAVENGKPRIRTSQLSLMPEGLEVMSDAEFRNLIWYILNPPQDNRPLTPALRQELIGEEGGPRKSADAGPPQNRALKRGGDDASASADASGEFRGRGAQPGDGESVALWNPDWKVLCPPFEGAPKKLPEFAGRKNVLLTHPVDRNTPATLERTLEIPAGQRTRLTFAVAADERGDWELRVRADGQLLQQRLVTKNEERWLPVSVDLSPFAGKTIVLRLENFPNDWNYEFAYWNDVQINSLGQSAKAQ